MGPARGPIVAIVTGTKDPSRAVAEQIAVLGREKLTVLPVSGSASVQDISSALGETRERLIVMARDDADQGIALAAARGVPVLVVEPT
jgi:hypothetical protein